MGIFDMLKGKEDDSVLRVNKNDTEGEYWMMGINYKGIPLTGICYELHENGQLKTEMYVKNGKCDGLSKEYYQNEQLKLENNWKNGKIYEVKKWFLKTLRIDGLC